jgi:hypothetical protein
MILIEVNRLLGISIPSFRQKTTPNSQPIYPIPLFTHGRPKDRPSEAAMTPTPRLAFITIAGARAFKSEIDERGFDWPICAILSAIADRSGRQCAIGDLR